MATLKDIAVMTGVSLSTVSRVINNSSSVDEALRKKVELAAKQLQYSPNLTAKSLRTKSTKLIGLVSEGNENYMFSHLINYVSDYCTTLGYSLIVANHHNDPAAEELIINNLQQRGVDGMILSLVSKESHVIPEIIRAKVPIAIFDRYMLFDQLSMGENSFSLVLDNNKAGQIAAKYLANLGHSDIALAAGPSTVDITRMRTRGFYNELYKYGIIIPKSRIHEGGFRFEDGVRTGESLLRERGSLPTAIWAQNDMMAVGILAALEKHGVRVPEDVSIMGMDGIYLSQLVYPALTTIAQPYERMAHTAVDMILGRYEGDNNRTTFEPEIIVRSSTGSPRKE